MAFLPQGSLKLCGGCYCRSIRYDIKVPALADRPLIPTALPTPITAYNAHIEGDSGPTVEVQTRLPVIDLDHCCTCRRTSGALVQCWIICPAAWVRWSLVDTQTIADVPDSKPGEDSRITLSTVDALGPATHNAAEMLQRTTISHFQASGNATRSFCSKCGTTLSYVAHESLDTDMPTVDVTVGSLDTASLEIVRPDRHGWYGEGVDWIKDLLTHGDGGRLIRHPQGMLSTSVEM